MNKGFFSTDIKFLSGVGPQRAELLATELSIRTFGDLLNHFPFRYEDRTKFYTVSQVKADLPYMQLKGKIVGMRLEGEKNRPRLIAKFQDASGSIDLLWFQGVRWIRTSIKSELEYILFGKPSVFKGHINIVHPELELTSEAADAFSPSLHPVYHTTEKLKTRGLGSRGIGKLIKSLIQILPAELDETLSESILHALSFIKRKEALIGVHLPSDAAFLKKAQLRLKFEELFYLQLRIQSIKVHRQEKYKGLIFDKVGNHFHDFYNHRLPFTLTNAQKKVMKEIRHDLGNGKQMNRLLQGDVGSGKTLVALMSMLICADNGFQSCLMAPTEILAQQHFLSISKYCKESEIKVALLTGSTKKSERTKLHAALASGELNILIGTHALIEDQVVFKNLGLVVIDEQHRFGVEQRAKLWAKNLQPPHILIMTATPIPRTLAMTIYGDLDVSVIDELPPGRTPILTYHRTDANRLRIFGFMKEQIRAGRQVYVVYPLIQESEKLDLMNLEEGYLEIVKVFPAPEFQVSVVHGKMKAADKEMGMERFRKKETQIMVATSVIEVGVDIPNATLMIIESAERFGLSQLHQLRGRVGRGAEQSHCILATGFKLSTEAKLRIDTMVRTTDGFEIAEVDLQLRGHGDMEGTRQSGTLNLKIANLTEDLQIVRLARDVAFKVLSDDPFIEKQENRPIKIALDDLIKNVGDWSRIS